MGNDNSVVVSIVGDASGVGPAINETKADLAGLRNDVASSSASISGLRDEMKTSFAAGTAASKDLAGGMVAVNAAVHGNTIAMRESLVVTRELMRGNWTRMPGSLSILAQAFSTSGQSARGFASSIAQSFGLIKKYADSELSAVAAAAAATAGTLKAAADRAAANVVAADAELLLAEAAVRNAETADAAAAAEERLAAAHAGVATAAGEATIAEDALAGAQASAAETAAAAEAATVVSLGGIATALIAVAAVAAPVAIAFKDIKDQANDSEDIKKFEENLGLTRREMKRITDDTVTWGDVFSATMDIILERAGTSASGVKSAWHSALSWLGDFTKMIIGLMLASFAMLLSFAASVSNDIGLAIGKGIAAGVNAALGSFESLINGMIDGANKVSGIFKAFGIDLGNLSHVHLKPLDAQGAFSNPLKDALAQGRKTFKEVGEGFDEIGRKANELRNARVAKEGAEIIADRPPKRGRHPREKDDLVQQLEAEIEARKTAWAEEQDAQGTFQEYSLQSEADFWAQALKIAGLSQKDKLAIEKKYLAARQALRKEQIENELDGYKQDLEAAGANAAAKLAILEKERAFIERIYGANSKEARQAADEVRRAQREALSQQLAIQADIAKAKQDAALAGVDAEQAAAEFEVEMGRESKSQLLAQERDFENQRFEIRRKGLIESLRLAELDPNTSPQKLRQIQSQIEELERQHQQKLTDIDRQATLERTRIQRNGINQVSQSWAQTISQMITRQIGWRDGLISIWQGLVGTVASVIQQILQQWIAAFLTKLILGKQEAASTVASHVAEAGAGGVASMAAAPFPINLTAPAFGASMAAAAASFGAIAAAEGGDWRVREGLYHLHEDEMVLPQWAASPLRSMIAGGGGSGGQSAFFGKGDATKASSRQENHFTYAPSISHSNMGFAEMLRRSERQMRRWFINQVRNGSLKLPVD